jgi:uncharacterized protein YndB with AHSA1/START domain
VNASEQASTRAESRVPSIRCAVDVPLSAQRAFALFTEHLAIWWPREYSWGQDVLEHIGLDLKEGGRCYELGPHGFRCDWGRVLSWEPPRRLVLAWHIRPRREPVPDPRKASTIEVIFAALTPAQTRVDLEHRDFERHEAGAEEYRNGLASADGWPLILERYRSAGESSDTLMTRQETAAPGRGIRR